MEKIKLEISNLSPSQLQAGSFTIVLNEVAGERRLPIIIGMFEAQAIAIEMEKLTPTRPLTHDLFKTFAKSFDYSVEEVHISDIQEGVFFSKIICTDGIRQKNIDARPSDAVAIALRFNAPIYTNEEVLTIAGINSEDLGEDESNPSPDETENPIETLLSDYTTEQLEDLLKEAIDNEEYERAALIRDELDKRN